MSHIIRCEVLDAQHDDRFEWLDETMDYMADRYPQLGDIELAQLEIMGRQFLRPVIPHGAGHSAITRDRKAEAEAEESQAA